MKFPLTCQYRFSLKCYSLYLVGFGVSPASHVFFSPKGLCVYIYIYVYMCVYYTYMHTHTVHHSTINLIRIQSLSLLSLFLYIFCYIPITYIKTSIDSMVDISIHIKSESKHIKHLLCEILQLCNPFRHYLKLRIFDQKLSEICTSRGNLCDVSDHYWHCLKHIALYTVRDIIIYVYMHCAYSTCLCIYVSIYILHIDHTICNMTICIYYI